MNAFIFVYPFVSLIFLFCSYYILPRDLENNKKIRNDAKMLFASLVYFSLFIVFFVFGMIDVRNAAFM